MEKSEKATPKSMTGDWRTWNRDFRRQIQRLMKEKGVYSGAIDGSFGPGTRRAMDASARN